MQVKHKIYITIEIDSKYKWMARQPFGEWTLFVNEPQIVTTDEPPGSGFMVSYWGKQDDELELTTLGRIDEDNEDSWKHSKVILAPP